MGFENDLMKKMNQPKISDKEIDEVSENELADITERESEWQEKEKRFLDLINYIKKEYSALTNEIKDLSDEDKIEVEKLTGIKLNEVFEKSKKLK